MSDSENELSTAKEKLSVELGEEQMQTYMSNLVKWFRRAYTKNEFGAETRKLLQSEKMHLHNDFMLAILNKINIRSLDSQNKSDSQTKTGNRQSVFIPINITDYLSDEEIPDQSTGPPQLKIRYHVNRRRLLRKEYIYGWLLVIGFEYGVTEADMDVAEIIEHGVEVLMKNILTEVVKLRKSFRTTNDGHFYYDLGCQQKNPFTINTATRQVIDDQQEYEEEDSDSESLKNVTNDDDTEVLAACEAVQQPPDVDHRITLRDLYITLQDKTIIPIHSVYALTMERITLALQYSQGQQII